MIFKRLLAFILLAQAPFFIEAYSSKASKEQAAALNDLQGTCSRLQHQFNNSKSEIKMFEERLLNFEVMLEAVRDEMGSSKEQQKESLNTKNQSLELRIAQLEQSNKALIADLKQFSTHANETSAAIKAYQKKITELESSIALQNRNLTNMQNALSSLLEAFQGKADCLETAFYKVKNGDSLAKIAKAHQTSVQAIKDLNGMHSDKIIVGKTLKIPCKP
ncbi:Uncharacterized protein PHSC3_000882 [Chlamydiales bacterium STE3]|nr:Uncharacterized protein PHSC3_000882 [Chlamydiales bacterium STE3]